MPVLYLIGCAAPPVRHATTGITLAQQAGWDVCLILTPSAARWLRDDLGHLETLTGHPVRSTYKEPEEPDVLPPADALLTAPITLNTLSSWALGIANTLALGLLTEGIGKRLPIVALPYINAAQAAHPALTGHIRVLEAAGVSVLLGEGGHVPHPPGHGNAAAFPWKQALDRLPKPE
jgi:phosphopantothenoylcysteine synthetase/decarboxylase